MSVEMAVFQAIVRIAGLSHGFKKSNTSSQTSLSYSLQHSHRKFLKSSKFKANLVHAMDFELFKLFSVITIYQLYLARKCKTRHETYKQTCKWQELAGEIYSLHN